MPNSQSQQYCELQVGIPFQKQQKNQCIFKDRVMISKWKCGSLLGQNGQTIKAIQIISGTKILVDQQHETPVCHVSGNSWSGVQFARRIMQDIGNKTFKGFSVIRDFADVHLQLQSAGKLKKEIPLAIYVPSRGFISHSQIKDEFLQISQQNGIEAGNEYLRGNWHSMSGNIFVYTTHSGFVEYRSQDFLPHLVAAQEQEQETTQQQQWTIQIPQKQSSTKQSKQCNLNQCNVRSYQLYKEGQNFSRNTINLQDNDPYNFSKLQNPNVTFPPPLFDSKGYNNFQRDNATNNNQFGKDLVLDSSQYYLPQDYQEMQENNQKLMQSDNFCDKINNLQDEISRFDMQQRISQILQKVQNFGFEDQNQQLLSN
eukprot:TRINITY_DN1318_c1_g1_i5.p1 TRINITY_DN1318_c1_g1~~TRINITY_DN1318_c1_g1_i5.p1  ORF type:complete len:369 (+),score=33.04 TRINITY_DN1318_c1_g1_i5:634-1740(+)